MLGNNYLGDTIHTALSSVGITARRVSHWLGRPCGCEERQQKLNSLDQWARRVIKGHTTNALHYLKQIMGDSNVNDNNIPVK